MWYFVYWVLNIIIKLLCVLAGRAAVDIWWWPRWGWGVLYMVNVDLPWWQWHLNGSRLSILCFVWFVQESRPPTKIWVRNSRLGCDAFLGVSVFLPYWIPPSSLSVCLSQIDLYSLVIFTKLSSVLWLSSTKGVQIHMMNIITSFIRFFPILNGEEN